MIHKDPTLELFMYDETARAPELVKDDETIRGLERDNATTAFELDSSPFAPEVSGSASRGIRSRRN